MLVALTKVVTEAVKGLYSSQMIADLTMRGIYMSQVGLWIGIGFVGIIVILCITAILGKVYGHWNDGHLICIGVAAFFLLITIILIPTSISSEYQWRHYPDIQLIRQILE